MPLIGFKGSILELGRVLRSPIVANEVELKEGICRFQEK